MSKKIRSFTPIFAVFATILQIFTNASGQIIKATVRVSPNEGPAVTIIGESAIADRKLSFLRSVAGINNLGQRISEVGLFDENGKEVSFTKFIDGEYVAVTEFTSWSYKVDLTPPKNRVAAAHTSWLTSESGLLMLADLLPAVGNGDKEVSAKVKIILPIGWQRLNSRADDFVETKDAASEVIAIGKGIRFYSTQVNKATIKICIAGEWHFTDNDIMNFAREIYTEFNNVFGSEMSNEVIINYFRFPQETAIGQWQAETRGRNVTVISSDMPFKSQSLQRLHEQLRHELFHLWLPNGVNLSGNYDWFYEGFALYRSLKLGVAVNRIRFEDFLNTLSRAHDIDRLSAPKVSLIDASRSRWTSDGAPVYSRGMLVAFLCDIAMLDASEGKISTDVLLRALYQRHRPPASVVDGNTAILRLLNSRKEVASIVDRYILGNEPIDWLAELRKAGLEATTKDHSTRLAVMPKLTGRQKKLLDKLGYNNWRRLANNRR